MGTLRLCIVPAIVAATVIGTAAFVVGPRKQVDTRDTELRLMAMLYVSATMR